MDGLWQGAEFWHWWAFAIALVAIEIVAPSTLLLWPAISAAVIGFALLVEPEIEMRHQILAFAVLAVITTVAWQVWLRRHPTRSDRPTLNRRARQYVGRRVSAVGDFVNGRGRVRVDDTEWTAEAEPGHEISAGASVEVESADGTVLKVRPVEARESEAPGSEAPGGEA